MKSVMRIIYIHTAALRRASLLFWKEGPLLPRLLTCNYTVT
ncbi:MAG TPA: hypothetical protein VFM05_04045 [Candidatus Saccharimonadales bacterium]|nr:hypothetical protein [Candidatus Saccharimonadales bacterium]